MKVYLISKLSYERNKEKIKSPVKISKCSRSLHRLQQYGRHSKNIRSYNVQSWEAACDAHVTMGETATGAS